jgi:hypothetical protein
MFQKREITDDELLVFMAIMIIYFLVFLIDLIKKKDWKGCFVFTLKCVLTIPVLMWINAMNLFLVLLFLWAGVF